MSEQGGDSAMYDICDRTSLGDFTAPDMDTVGKLITAGVNLRHYVRGKCILIRLQCNTLTVRVCMCVFV